MTQTKKQRSIMEEIAAESDYARAAATWVARKLGLDPGTVYAVDFGFEDDYRLSDMTWQPGDGVQLVYKRRGKTNRLKLDVMPGEFIEQCVEILTESS